jgi:hypothetical protein
MARPALVTMRDRDRKHQATSSARLAQGWGQVKILDMGLARLTEGLDEDRQQSEHTPLTRAGALLGTPDFIAPEQARDARNVDIRADIYSLGCTFYYILTGKPPFPGGTDVQKLIRHQTEKAYPIEELRPGIPAEVTTVLNRMLEKRPEDRYPTPQHLADALDQYLAPAIPSTPVPTSVAETPPVAETPVPVPAPRQPAAPPPPASVPTFAPLPPSTKQPMHSPHRDTIPSPAGLPLRDTMPVPPALAESLQMDASGATRPSAVTRPRVNVTAHTGVVSAVAFSVDSKVLATAGIDGRVRLWDITGSTARELATFPKPGAEFHSVAFAPHDDFLVAGGVAQGTARVWRWDWKDGKVAEWGAYQGDKVGVPTMAFAPDGKRFVAGIGPFVVSWKVNGRSAGTGEILKGHGGAVRTVAWSQDGKKIASAGESHFVIVWGFGWLGASQKSKFRSHTDVLTAVSFSPDGRRLAVGGFDRQVMLWDADDPKEETSVPLVGHAHHLRLVQYLSDGSLMTVGVNGQIFVWDAAAAVPMTEYQLSERVSSSIAISPDGKRVAVGGSDGRVALFDTVRAPSAATIGE